MEKSIDKDINSVPDILFDEELVYNNTFNLKALNETLEKLSVTNFWSLYQAQRSRLKIQRFDLPFNEFKLTTRLTGEKVSTTYPKRYVAYVNYTFIEPELRKRYRNSDFFNTALNQEVIASNHNLFTNNFMIFINGEFIYTSEIYPLESKTGVIIDVESTNNKHGISYNRLIEYTKSNPIVTIIMVPNFYMTNILTNKFVLEDYNYRIPISNIPNGNKFNKTTVCFTNVDNGISNRYLERGIRYNNFYVNIDKNITPGGNNYRFCFITFPDMYNITNVSYNDPYFKLDTKMPNPVEHSIAFVKDKDSKFIFDRNIKIKLFYPNIYKIEGLKDGDTAIVFNLYNDTGITENEKYINEISKYEEYVELLPKYKDNSVPDVLKHYRPSTFVYSIDDYNNSIYVPSTMNYKVQKLHKTIYENPWALAVYLDLLGIPSDKFYLDMENIDLTTRIRKDTNSEELDDDESDITFDEDMYVFSMNRHFMNTRAYGFHIFIDGLFQRDGLYTIKSGTNFYYIYIPVSSIKEDSMIEIERYKLYSFEKVVSTDSIDNPIIEYDLSNEYMVGYSREIYVADKATSRYLKPEKDFRLEVLYKFAEGGERWSNLPLGKNIPIENKFRVYLINENYVNRELYVGINRTMSQTTSEECDENSFTDGVISIYEYVELKMRNQGGYNKGNYRVFNNGKLLLPNQYYNYIGRYKGEYDMIRTGCKIYTGDRITLDRAPACFTLIYYKNEVDEVNKKGYVDLDGKVPLPISLKWYDIYINGVKLHKKNIEIISPTKFYISGVDSRKHLMILIRDRDPEIFKLGPHKNTDSPDWNNTIMDELMEGIYGLKEIIDDTKDEIDPNNETREIASNVCNNIDAMSFFYDYLMYSFINANYKQITQEIKDKYPSLVDENGVMLIDQNEGCSNIGAVGGFLIKLIECNYLDERSADMFTADSVDFSGLGILQDRFAIRPLNISNYEIGLVEEFMCDPVTGEPAIKNADGTVTTVSTLFRLKNFIESFSTNIIMYGMGKSDIYQIAFDDEYKVYVYNDGDDIITSPIKTTKAIKKFSIGLDATFLTKVGDSNMLKIADENPMVTIVYLDGDREITVEHSISRLSNYVFDASNNEVTIKSMTLSGISEGVKTFLHSLLIAY